MFNKTQGRIRKLLSFLLMYTLSSYYFQLHSSRIQKTFPLLNAPLPHSHFLQELYIFTLIKAYTVLEARFCHIRWRCISSSGNEFRACRLESDIRSTSQSRYSRKDFFLFRISALILLTHFPLVYN